MLYNGNCASQCPAGTYPSNVQCYDCMTNCSTCTNDTRCTTCAPTHYLEFNGLCLSQCPLGYEERNKICEKVVIPDPIDPIEPNNTDPDNNQTDPPTPVDPPEPIDPNPPIYPVDPTEDDDDVNYRDDSAPVIKTQTLSIDEENKKLIIKTFFEEPVDPSSITLEFFFVDMETHKKTKLKTKSKVEKRKLKQGSQVNELSYEADIPSGMKLSSNAL